MKKFDGYRLYADDNGKLFIIVVKKGKNKRVYLEDLFDSTFEFNTL